MTPSSIGNRGATRCLFGASRVQLTSMCILLRSAGVEAGKLEEFEAGERVKELGSVDACLLEEKEPSVIYLFLCALMCLKLVCSFLSTGFVDYSQ